MKGEKFVTKPNNPTTYFSLPWFIRFYIYGIQGFADEIVFTAVFDFFALDGAWTLRGTSSLSSFLIYGTCSFFVERLYVFLYYKHGIQWYVRVPLYVCISYSWEFITGLLLRQFDACPWDYSLYTYNFMGLITLEYAPGWAFLAVIQDLMADFLLRVRMLPSGDMRAMLLPVPMDAVASSQKEAGDSENGPRKEAGDSRDGALLAEHQHLKHRSGFVRT